MKCFVERYNQRDSSILQLFNKTSTFEYVNIRTEMPTEEALMLMDRDVMSIEAYENSLVIEYDPTKAGFSLFFNTFEGYLHMKTAEGNCLPQDPKPFKISFMVEG